MRSRGYKILSVVCSAALCVALLPVAALSGLIDSLGEGIGDSAVAVAQPAPPDEGIASEQGATAVTFAQLKERSTDEDYRESVDYAAGRVLFAVRDVRDDGASVQRLSDRSTLCEESGLTGVEFVYESQSKTAQVKTGKTAYDVYYEASISDDDVWGTVDALNARDEVLYAEPDIEWQNTAVGSYTEATVEEVHEAWQLDSINAKAAWQKSYAASMNPGQGAVVAVIDTGVDYSHIDLANSMWKNGNETFDGTDNDGDGYADDVYGVNLITGSGDPQDDQGHGTHVAGIIAAQAGNGGSVGVAYGAQIMAIKAGQSTGTFAASDIAKGIRYAVDHGADVINMSFGGTGRSAVVEAALADAFSTCVLVASAGNDGLPTTEALAYGYIRAEDIYPAGYNYVLGAMSCDGNGNLSSFSNWDYASGVGCEYELIAPGENVYSTLPGDRYAKWSGTSMAAPEVSAAAAIVRSMNADKSKYTSRYIMGQLSSASDKSVAYPKLDILASLEKTPTPDLSIVETYFFDNPSINPKNNGDGIAQPGETIDLGVVVRNQWGIASNVMLTADSVSDMGVASPYISFETDKANIQDIGTFAQVNNGFTYSDGVLAGASKPIRFTVSENATNDMQLAINLHVTASNGMDKFDTTAYTAGGQKTFTVRNGQALHGKLTEDTTLTSDKLWIIDSGLLVPEGVTLTIEPGAKVQYWSNESSSPYKQTGIAYIQVDGKMIASGTASDPIDFYVCNSFPELGILMFGNIDLRYCRLQNPWSFSSSGDNFDHFFSIQEADHCWFYQDVASTHYSDSSNGRYGTVGRSLHFDICSKSVFDGFRNVGNRWTAVYQDINSEFFKECLVSDSQFLINGSMSNTALRKVVQIDTGVRRHINHSISDSDSLSNCAILNNLNDYSTDSWSNISGVRGNKTIDISGNYWGTSDASLVKRQVNDSDSNPELCDLVQEPFLTLDSPELESIYPFVTEAYLTEGTGTRLDTVDSGRNVQLHVKFNRDMNQSVQPMVSYGPAEPYTDYAAYGDWVSAREWVGSIHVDQFIDQGEEFIRVKDAVAADDAWLKTGTDAGRFKFNVSKVNTAAMTLQGSAEKDGVHLSWKQDDYSTLAGYNVYRTTSYDKEKPASEQNFQKVNNAVIPATVGKDGDVAAYGAFQDSSVAPVTDYYYYFTVVDTQFNESEPSNVVKASTSAIDLSKAVISVGEQTYTGQNVCPDPYVTLNGAPLRKGTDYTVAFENNTQPGTATVTITGKGVYSGQASAMFDIVCGHTLSSTVKLEPTCESTGTRHFTCTTCGYEYDEAIAPLGHEPVEDAAIEATCNAPGKKAGSHCARCNEVLQPQLEVPALGHAWAATTVNATCETPGSINKTCTRCGAAESTQIPALGHEPVEDAAVPATCTNSGKTAGSHCARCGKVIEAQQPILALGHDFSATVVEPTCSEGGHTDYKCTRCGYAYVSNYTRPAPHDFTSEITEPATCEQDGVRTYTCGTCGFQYTEAVLKVGHDWGEWMIKQMPTTQSTGIMERVCSVCSSVEDKDVAKLDPSLNPAPIDPMPDPGTGGGSGGGGDAPAPTFPDVDYSESSWYGEAVTYVAGKSLITGYTSGDKAGQFGVGDTLTRAQLATILWRNACPDEAASYDAASAKDSTGIAGSADGMYYTAAANWAVKNGVISGFVREDGTKDFAADEAVSFEQLITILSRVSAAPGEVAGAGSDLSAFVDGSDASSWSAASLKWAADKGLVEGYDTPSGKVLSPGEDVARERVAVVLMRAFETGILK